MEEGSSYRPFLIVPFAPSLLNYCHSSRNREALFNFYELMLLRGGSAFVFAAEKQVPRVANANSPDRSCLLRREG